MSKMDPNEYVDLDNTEYDAWSVPSETEYNDDEYEY